MVVWWWGGWSLSPGQVDSPSQGHIEANKTNEQIHAHSEGQFRDTNEPNMHVFGWWEEAGVPVENPRILRENMQTPHRKAPAGN